MKEIIKEIILTYQNKNFSDVKNRDLEIDFNTWKIISIIWPRRAGKSYFLFSLIKNNLLLSKKNKSDFLYINFEDERLDLLGKDLGLIIDSYRELYSDKKIEDSYFFFDEIQNVVGWEKFVRRIYDEWLKNIFITWSNAKLLSKEIATSLRGRSISYEILPLDFKEYLAFKNVEIENIFKKEDRVKILYNFGNYLKWGGFPEIIDYEENLKIKVLQEYFEVMLYNDVIERYKIKDVSLLKNFVKRLLQTATKEFSVNKLFNELKSLGYKFDKNVLYDFLEYVEIIYFGKVVHKFDFSLKKQYLQKKFYAIDVGFLNSLSFKFSDNHGKLLENLVFLYLNKKFGENVYFIKNSVDVDFIVNSKEKVVYQVCYNLTVENRDREIVSLKKALKKYQVNKGYLITKEQFGEVDENIKIIPFYSLYF